MDGELTWVGFGLVAVGFILFSILQVSGGAERLAGSSACDGELRLGRISAQ